MGRLLRYFLFGFAALSFFAGCFSGGTDGNDDEKNNPTVADFDLHPKDGQVDISWDAKFSYNYAYARSDSKSCEPIKNPGACTDFSTATIQDGAYADTNGLTNFKTYYYWLIVRIAGDVGVNGPKSTAPSVIQFPNDLSSDVGDSTADLNWTALDGLTYNFYLSSDATCDVYSTNPNNNFSTCAESRFFQDVKPTFSISGLTNETDYYAWMEVVNDVTKDLKTPSISFKPFVDLKLPTDFTADAGDLASVLRWTANSLDTYNFYRSTDPNCDPTADIYACAGGFFRANISPGHRDRVSQNNIDYYYWLEAERKGSKKQTSSIKVRPSTINLTAPNDFDITSDVEKLILSWSRAPFYHYGLYRSTNPNCVVETSTDCDNLKYFPTVTSPYTDDNLPGLTQFSYWLEARNGGRTQVVAGPATATTKRVVLALPTDFTATSGEKLVTLSWTESPGLTYNIHRSTDDDTVCQTNNFSACTDYQYFLDVTSDYKDTAGLVVGTPYFYWIEATKDSYTEVGQTAVSATPAAISVETPSGFVASPGPLRVNLSWTAAADPQTVIAIHKSTDANCNTQVFSSCLNYEFINRDNSDDSYEDTNVSFGTDYYYWLEFGKNGASNLSGQVTATPNNSTVILPVLNVTSDDLKVNLNWTSRADHTYDIHRSSDASCDPNTISSCSGKDYTLLTNLSSPYEDKNLTYDTVYYYWMEAKNSMGNSLIANSPVSGEAKSVPLTFPGPGQFYTKAGQNEITLFWSTTAGQTYNLVRSDDPNCNTSNPSGCSNSAYPKNVNSGYVFTGLLDNVTYYFWLEVAKNGFSAFHTDNTSDTPTNPSANTAPPTTSGNVQVPGDFQTTGGAGTIEASWTADPAYEYDIGISTDSNCNTSNFPSCNDGQLFSLATSTFRISSLSPNTYFVWLLVREKSGTGRATVGPRNTIVN